MATIDDINNGMTFEELLSSGNSSDSTYTALLSDLIDQIEFATSPEVQSDINTLMSELIASNDPNEQQLIANAICDKLTQFANSLDQVIDSDLASQQVERSKLSSLNIAAALIPPETIRSTPLFNAIASDNFKQIIKDNT